MVRKSKSKEKGFYLLLVISSFFYYIIILHLYNFGGLLYNRNTIFNIAHRRQAALNEVQRLKVEGTLRPAVPGSPEIEDTGSLTVSAITLPLRREYLRSIATSEYWSFALTIIPWTNLIVKIFVDTCLHFVCLIRYLEEVLTTPVVLAESGDSCLRFPSTLKLQNLYSDFKITVEIYSLQTQAEMLPHEVKYHIHNNGGGWNSGNSSKDNKKVKLYSFLSLRFRGLATPCIIILLFL